MKKRMNILQKKKKTKKEKKKERERQTDRQTDRHADRDRDIVQEVIINTQTWLKYVDTVNGSSHTKKEKEKPTRTNRTKQNLVLANHGKLVR